MITVKDNSTLTPEERAKWLEERRHGIGSSDAAAIVGLDPYKSAARVFFDKMGTMPQQELSEAMRFGIDAEEYVAQRFTEATGKQTITYVNSVTGSKEYYWALASIDRFIPDEGTFVEIKTTSVWNINKFKDGKYPANYYVQCVHQMAVLEVPYCYLAVYIPGVDFKWFKIERNMDEEKALMDAEKHFWEEYVLKKTAPSELSHSDNYSAVLDNEFSDIKDSVQLVDSISYLEKLKMLQLEKKQIEKEIDECKAHIAVEMQGAKQAYTDTTVISMVNRTTNSLVKDKVLAKYPEIQKDKELWKSTTSVAMTLKQR